MAKQQPIKKFVSRNLSESIEKSVQDAVDSGIDVSELVDSISKEPTNVVARNYYNEAVSYTHLTLPTKRIV